MLCSVLGFKPHLPQQNTLSPIISPIMHAHPGSDNMEGLLQRIFVQWVLLFRFLSFTNKPKWNSSKILQNLFYRQKINRCIFTPPFNFLLQLVCADKLFTKLRSDLRRPVSMCWTPVKMWFENTGHFLDFFQVWKSTISSDFTICVRKENVMGLSFQLKCNNGKWFSCHQPVTGKGRVDGTELHRPKAKQEYLGLYWGQASRKHWFLQGNKVHEFIGGLWIHMLAFQRQH